ncbi:MAG TPA: serine hydrolase domain-containing protein [Candidatus Tumulicola sp.]|jgi:CubicO group peptidase (beta-lactamase class C family)
MSKALAAIVLVLACALTWRPGLAATVEIQRIDGRTISTADVDRRAESLMQAGRVPGLAIGIINDGRLVYVRAYGLRDVAACAPLETDTIMYAASLTKAAAAYMVMQLVDEHYLDLDRPVYEYLSKPLPSYSKYADLKSDARYELLTARMLLAHTSGLPNWRFISADGKLDIKFSPGTRYSYSGEGINLLQFVLEKGLGLNVDRLMRERIFIPFDMRRSSLAWQPQFASNTALGYDEKGVPLGHHHRTDARAAGSMDTTITDYTSFIAATLRHDGLSAASWQEMLQPQIAIDSVHQFPTPSSQTTSANRAIELSYGLGWGLFTSPYGRAYFKEGHDDGTENYTVAFPDAGTALVILTNSSNGESIFKYLLADLIGDTYTPWFWESYYPYDYTGVR